MAKKIRITRKTLKQDEVRSYGLTIYEWLRKNQKQVLIGAVVVAVVFLFALAYRSRAASRRASANIMFTTAEQQIRLALIAKDEQLREKLFNAAEEKLQTILDTYGRSKLATEALYLLGDIAFFRNKYDEAERFYKEYIEATEKPEDKADGYIALGYTYENKFFWTPQGPNDNVWLERAIESYRKAEALTSGTLQTYLAMLGRARLYALQENKIDKAKELYERIAKERKIGEPKQFETTTRAPYAWVLNQMERMRRLFTLAETARLRLDRLKAGD